MRAAGLIEQMTRGLSRRTCCRDPPGRLFWPRPWAAGALVTVMLAVAGVLALLHLSWIGHFVVVGMVAVFLSFLWALGRPILEEDR
jgi:hypothetical protein